MVVVCKWCRGRKILTRPVVGAGSVVLCPVCDFGPCGMAGLPVAERVKDVPK